MLKSIFVGKLLVVELLGQVIQLELGHQRGRETALKVEVAARLGRWGADPGRTGARL